MKQRYERTLLTQEEYRKQQRNLRWLKTAIIGIPAVLAVASFIGAMWMWVQHVG